MSSRNMSLSFSRKIGESYVNLKYDSPQEVQTLCDQEIPPRGLIESKVIDCRRRRLILDILRLKPEDEVSYHLFLRDEESASGRYWIKLSAEKQTMRFELTNMNDTIELALVNPSIWRTIHLRLSIFEGHPSQFLPVPSPDEILRFRGKKDTM